MGIVADLDAACATDSPRLVLLRIQDDRTLVARAGTRIVGTLDTMPDVLFEEFRNAVAAYEQQAAGR